MPINEVPFNGSSNEINGQVGQPVLLPLAPSVITFDFGNFGAEVPLGTPFLVNAQLIEALARRRLQQDQERDRNGRDAWRDQNYNAAEDDEINGTPNVVCANLYIALLSTVVLIFVLFAFNSGLP